MSEAIRETEAFEKALEQLRAGDFIAAENIVSQAATAARARCGAGSPEDAASQFDLAKILVGIGDLRRAAQALREASNLKGDGEQAIKNRLTYLLNLGEILQREGDLEGAEKILQEGLVDRAAFYGEEHPGYAFGLEPLAEVLRLRGKLAEASEIIDEAIRIFWQNSHPRVASALAKHAGIVKAQGGQALRALDHLPEAIVNSFVEEILNRSDQEDTNIYFEVLKDLRQWLLDRRGPDDDWLLHVVAAISTTARALRAEETRQEALNWLVEAQAKRADTDQQINALLGLGLAEDEAGKFDAAERSYRRALELAVKQEDPTKRSKVMRNVGLFLAHRDQREVANSLLQSALAEAQTGGDDETLGKALVSLGIFRQHDGNLEEARVLLEQALSTLEPSHPDALYARSHLKAIESGGNCGCGGMMHSAIGDALKVMVLEQCPEGLVERLEVVIGEDNKPRFEISFAREPEPGETKLIERVVHQATDELCRRIRQQGFASH